MAEPIPTFDIPGMGRMTAAEFAEAYNSRGEGGSLVVLGPSRLEWREDRRGSTGLRINIPPINWTQRSRPFASLFEPRRYRDPLFYIGAPPC